MKRNFNPLYLAIAILMIGCSIMSTPTTFQKNQQETKLATLTSTAIRVSMPTQTPSTAVQTATGGTFIGTATPAETATPTHTPTPNIPHEARLLYHCIDIEPELPADTVSDGQLILDSRVSLDGRYKRETFILDMATRKMTQVNEVNEGGVYFSASPDRNLLAFLYILFNEDDNVIEEKLEITSANGQRLVSVPYENGWSGIAGWLDNQRLVINISILDPDESHARKAASLLVLNPLSGERRVLRPDFPDIYNYSPVPNWDEWGISMYDPTLTRAVYLRINEEGHSEYTLWDMENEQVLATQRYNRQVPRWSPDGSYVVLGGLPDDDMKFETFLISRDGEVEQLTNLNAYVDMDLVSYSWSPDGRYIAAWLRSLQEDRGEGELAVVDTVSGWVTNYCVRGKWSGEGYGGGFPLEPLWSPDGRQIIVQDWYERDHRRVILVDPAKGLAAEIAQDMEPVGWMVSASEE